MSEIKKLIEHGFDSTKLLMEVICAMEDSDCGYVPPNIYVKIKNHIGEDNYPENMQKQINTYEELYG